VTLAIGILNTQGSDIAPRRLPCFRHSTLIELFRADIIRPRKEDSPRRTGSVGETVNAHVLRFGHAGQSSEHAFAALFGFSDTLYPQ
jgi:hypothetical protein